MSILNDIQSSRGNPQGMEALFQAASQAGNGEDFRLALEACYQESPDDVLYAAWHYRLQAALAQPARAVTGVNWKLAVPLSIATGLVFWSLSDFNVLFLNHIPHLVVFWAPIATLFALAFLAFTSQRQYRRSLLAGAALCLASLYVLLIAPGQKGGYHRPYLDLMAIHLPLLCWIALGISVLERRSSPQNKFAFLMKSVEVMITAGVYLIAGVAFGAITQGMFQALSIKLPEIVMRLIMAGGFGLIPLMALASAYNPSLSPQEQDFTQGLSRFVATMMRLLLPLSLAVLVIYIFIIPFNFMQPFKNRDVLIVYNVMLFGIMGLLIGATPVRSEELSPKLQKALRYGMLAVAILAALVSIYAISATVYRTVEGGITINRLTIIGWNSINIVILLLLIYRQLRYKGENWASHMKSVFSQGMVGYVVWDIFLIVAIPLLFR
jgi:hypothetical protein